MKKKLTIGIVFGGRSGEHEVSLVSASSVMDALNKKKNQIIQIGITRDGHMISGADAMKRLKSSEEIKQSEVLISPDPSDHGLINLKDRKKIKIDCFFPVLHGPYGEDGTIQGLFDLSGVSYVGAGVLGSACGMDKAIMKKLFKDAGLSVTDDVVLLHNDYKQNKTELIKQIEKEIGYPCFVKPANMGSSVGVSKAHDQKELTTALQVAFEFDRKVLVEKSAEKIREIECAVLGNDKPRASVCGEILSSEEFYSYKAKYIDESPTVIDADLPKKVTEEIRKQALIAFQAVDCSGMARVDFLVRDNFSKIYINEINTIPGFTSISMYPKLWEKSGVKYSELIDKLIEFGIERREEKDGLKVDYEGAMEVKSSK